MTLVLLDRLATAQEELVRALDSNDIALLERANAGLAAAVEAVRKGGGWETSPELRERLANLGALAQAVQVRVNFLTDGLSRRLSAAAALRGAAPNLTYQPAGR